MRLAGLTLLFLFRLLPAAQPPFRLFTVEDGLVRNWVQRIKGDSRGYLWFCTVEGLSIFDGSRFTNFTVYDGLPNRQTFDFLESSTGDYWIATGKGISRFHPNALPGGSHFENVLVSPAPGANVVTSIMEDSQHRLWLATEGGLFAGRPEGGTVSFASIALRAGTPPSLRAVVEDARHRIWAGAADGLYSVSPDGSVVHWDQEQGTPLGIKAMLLDRGKLWVGGEGFIGIDVSAERPTIVASYPIRNGTRLDVFALHRNPHGDDVWIGGPTEVGILRFRPEAAPERRFQPFSTSSVLARSGIAAMGSDAASNLWAGLDTLGAVRVIDGPSDMFSEADGLESPAVIGMVEDRKGKIYAVTGAMHTLNELANGRFEPRPRNQPLELSDMGWGSGPVVLQDRRGEWWVASGHGLLHYPATDDARTLAATQPRIYSRRDGLPDDVILRLFEDSRGDLWVGTGAGLARREYQTGKWSSFPVVADPVLSIAEDHSGAVWAGFASQHLLHLRGSTSEVITDNIPPANVNALLVDRLGRLWIGTSQGGLRWIDDPAVVRPRVQKPSIPTLSSDQIFALAEDLQGRLYIAGGRGVDRLNLESGQVQRLSGANVLPPGESHCLFRDRSGSIWFISGFGLARYVQSPDAPLPAPVPLLRRLSIGGAEYPLSTLGERSISGLELGPRDAHLEIDYRAVHLNSVERLRYQYRLRGASDQWSAPSELQSVRFANLASGRYVFEVRSVKDDGIAGMAAAIQFRVMPPLWFRPWFLAGAFFLFGGAAVTLHQYRLQHALIVERVRTRLATDLHDDLGAGLAEIAILSEVGRRNHDAGDVLGQVASRARNLRSTLGDIVWTVDPSKDHLPDLVRRMREIALNMLETEGRRVRFLAPAEAQLGNRELAADQRRHLLFFFKEAVANIAHHSDAREVDLEVAAVDGELCLSIRDNGRGFNVSSPREGHGLTSLRYRASELRGRVRIDSTLGGGTRIHLSLPIAK